MFKQVTFGDELAAEYLLLHLVSRYVARIVDCFALRAKSFADVFAFVGFYRRTVFDAKEHNPEVRTI